MKATFTFIDELNDFLPHYRKNKTFSLEFEPHQSLKHLIKSLGVPHTEFRGCSSRHLAPFQPPE
jgi:hypothetical protein